MVQRGRRPGSPEIQELRLADDIQTHLLQCEFPEAQEKIRQLNGTLRQMLDNLLQKMLQCYDNAQRGLNIPPTALEEPREFFRERLRPFLARLQTVQQQTPSPKAS